MGSREYSVVGSREYSVVGSREYSVVGSHEYPFAACAPLLGSWSLRDEDLVDCALHMHRRMCVQVCRDVYC